MSTEPKTELSVVKSESFVEKMLINTESIEDAKKLGTFIIESGFAPKQFTADKPSAIIIAIDMGASLGLKWSQSLQEIVIINNLPTLKGDGAKALILSSGKCDKWEEEYTGTFPNDDFTHKITARRKGDTKDTVATFSIFEAKRAGLWVTDADVARDYKNKYKPWFTYPKRMVRYRNVGFIARDLFPDVLKGLVVFEEAQDAPVDAVTVIATPQGPVSVAAEANPVTNSAAERIENKSTKPVAHVNQTAKDYTGLKVRTIHNTYDSSTNEIEVGFVGICSEDSGVTVSINSGEIVCPRTSVVLASDDEALSETTTKQQVIEFSPRTPKDDGVVKTDYTLEQLEELVTNPEIRSVALFYVDYNGLDDKKVTNKKLREIIIAGQNGTLAEFITKTYGADKLTLMRGGAPFTVVATPEEPISVAPVETKEAVAPIAKAPTVKKADPVVSENGLCEVKAGQERDFDEMRKVWDYFEEKGITDDNVVPVLTELGAGFVDLYESIEHICRVASLGDIDAIVKAFKK